MTAEEIIAHRDRYTKSIDYDTKEIYGPWVDNPEWMWKKTPLIKVLKLAPKSIELQQAVALTEQSEAGIQQRFSLDVPLELQPPIAGEDEAGDDEPRRKSEQAEIDREVKKTEAQGHGMTKVGDLLPGIAGEKAEGK